MLNHEEHEEYDQLVKLDHSVVGLTEEKADRLHELEEWVVNKHRGCECGEYGG